MRLQKGLDTTTRNGRRTILDRAFRDSRDRCNPFPGCLTLVVAPRLDAKSATRWYLFSDPAVIAALEYAFLESEEGPSVFVREGFEVDGAEFKVRLDFGAGALHFRGAYANPGA
jgi:hypothetical protein